MILVVRYLFSEEGFRAPSLLFLSATPHHISKDFVDFLRMDISMIWLLNPSIDY